MRTSDHVSEILPALLIARREMKPAHKGKKNAHFNYSYANEESWHDEVMPRILACQMVLTFSITDYVRTGTLTMVRGVARLTHVTSAQWIEVDGIGEGEDKADKGAFKAQTGLKKYLYSLLFALPTTDDAEDDENDKQRAKEQIRQNMQPEPVRTTVYPKPGTAADVPPKPALLAAAEAAATAAVDQGKVNAAYVANGLEPEHNQDDKDQAKALYAVCKAAGPDWLKKAQAIKHNRGTDYARMSIELQALISTIPKKENP